MRRLLSMTQVKLKLSRLLFALAIILLSFFAGYFSPQKSVIREISTPVLYKVVKVIDGDTIQVEINNKAETIRLIGVNTPEVQNPYKPEECFGKEASVKAKELLTNQSVYLIPDSLSSDRDKYNRLLRYVFLPTGELINTELIKNGFGFNYIYEPFQLMKQFDYWEKQAKENQLGLWNAKCNY